MRSLPRFVRVEALDLSGFADQEEDEGGQRAYVSSILRTRAEYSYCCMES